MNAKSYHEAESDGNSSRFAYHNELEPVEGGVRPVESIAKDKAPAKKAGRNTNGAHPPTGVNGIPGPNDRLLDISEIARNVGQFYKHRFAIEHREGDELDTAEPITGEVTLTNSGAALILRGHAKTVLNMECGRCLRPVQEAVETEIEEEFDLVGEHSAWGTADEVQAVDDDETGAVVKGNILDLGDLLRQYIILAAPANPECPDDCEGVELPEGVELHRADEVVEVHAEPVADNPLKHLAEMLEAKRQEQSKTA